MKLGHNFSADVIGDTQFCLYNGEFFLMFFFFFYKIL